jgi:hypothetical protein
MARCTREPRPEDRPAQTINGRQAQHPVIAATGGQGSAQDAYMQGRTLQCVPTTAPISRRCVSVVQFVHDGGRTLDRDDAGRVRDTAPRAWSTVSYMISFFRFGGGMGSRLRRVHSRLGGAAVASNEPGPLSPHGGPLRPKVRPALYGGSGQTERPSVVSRTRRPLGARPPSPRVCPPRACEQDLPTPVTVL